MSVLDRFEKSVEGAVNGVFAKFGSKDLQPVDLSSALEREIDAEAMPVGRDRTVAPNEYRFKLSTPDFDRIESWGSEGILRLQIPSRTSRLIGSSIRSHSILLHGTFRKTGRRLPFPRHLPRNLPQYRPLATLPAAQLTEAPVNLTTGSPIGGTVSGTIRKSDHR